MTVTYQINGFNLDKTDMCKVMDGTEYSCALAPRRLDLTIPGISGQVPMWNDPLDALKLTLQLRVLRPRRAPQTTLHTNVRLVQGVFRAGGFLQSSGAQGPLFVTRNRDGQQVNAIAQLETLSAAQYNHAGGFADMTAVLNIPLGMWQDAATEEFTFASTGTGSVNVTANYPASFQTFLPITNALLRARGPLTSVAIKDQISGTGVLWVAGATALAAGQYALIDPYNMNARRLTSASWDMTTGTDARGGLYSIWNGPFMVSTLFIGDVPTPATAIDITFGGATTASQVIVQLHRSEP